jgi:hypothetical protein
MVSDLAFVDGLTVRHDSEKLAAIVMAAAEQPVAKPPGIGLD